MSSGEYGAATVPDTEVIGTRIEDYDPRIIEAVVDACMGSGGDGLRGLSEGYLPEADQVHRDIGAIEVERQSRQPSSGPSRPGRFELPYARRRHGRLGGGAVAASEIQAIIQDQKKGD